MIADAENEVMGLIGSFVAQRGERFSSEWGQLWQNGESSLGPIAGGYGSGGNAAGDGLSPYRCVF